MPGGSGTNDLMQDEEALAFLVEVEDRRVTSRRYAPDLSYLRLLACGGLQGGQTLGHLLRNLRQPVWAKLFGSVLTLLAELRGVEWPR